VVVTSTPAATPMLTGWRRCSTTPVRTKSPWSPARGFRWPRTPS